MAAGFRLSNWCIVVDIFNRGILATLIALFTISFQAIRAAGGESG
jgi:hypothetical protein